MDEKTSKLVARWRGGDEQAAAELFRRYASRLTALARQKLSSKMASRVDAEDIVQSVYRSFFAAARQGRYELERGGDLWRLLVGITLHKVHGQVKRHHTGKRSVAKEQVLHSDARAMGLEARLLAQQPGPSEAAALADEVDRLMRRLSALQRRVLELRLQGYNLEEIAAAAACSERTVRYALAHIKAQLEQEKQD
ncbi:MAG: RNA polymerase sigma factor [Gemmataceae bacterium]